MDPTDVIRFGKKVNYENKITNMQVMEEHLRQMRSNFAQGKAMHESKRKQEVDFLNQVKELEVLESMRKKASIKAINEDFLNHNKSIQQERSD